MKHYCTVSILKPLVVMALTQIKSHTWLITKLTSAKICIDNQIVNENVKQDKEKPTTKETKDSLGNKKRPENIYLYDQTHYQERQFSPKLFTQKI